YVYLLHGVDLHTVKLRRVPDVGSIQGLEDVIIGHPGRVEHLSVRRVTLTLLNRRALRHTGCYFKCAECALGRHLSVAPPTKLPQHTVGHCQGHLFVGCSGVLCSVVTEHLVVANDGASQRGAGVGQCRDCCAEVCLAECHSQSAVQAEQLHRGDHKTCRHVVFLHLRQPRKGIGLHQLLGHSELRHHDVTRLPGSGIHHTACVGGQPIPL